LFVQALRQWQQESQSSPSSFYGVASIHGVPNQNYNNVGQCLFGCGDADGYCTHNSVLFPSWHRAYVAMWEQQFLIRVQNVARQYTGSNAALFQQAAQTMRWPYWDWAAKPQTNTPVLPLAVSQTRVTVMGPNGNITVGNPLYQYNYTDPGGMKYYPFTQWRASYRYPYSNNPNSGSAENQAVSAFRSQRPSLADQVYQLLTQCSDYLPFSNDNADNSFSSCSQSLEGIHNTVHVTAGGPGSNSVSSGHMSVLPTASFDPLFFLHHCNVDRIFAMWQAINPTKYRGEQDASEATWTIASGDANDENSNLTPFLKDNSGNFWTPIQLRYWNTTFAYTYPEFSNSRGDRAAIVSYARKLYGPSATATAGSSKRTAAPEPVAAADAAPTPAPVFDSSSSAEEAVEAPVVESRAADKSYHYVANIQTPRYYLKGSYSIYIFTGKPSSEDPTTWITDPNVVGSMGVLAHAKGQAMGSMKDVIIAGSVPLTRSLNGIIGTGLLADLSVPLVTAYLKANLNWRIQGPSGEKVDPKTLPGFVVSVAAATVTESNDWGVLPVYGSFSILADVTSGLVGGFDKTTKLLGNVLENVVGGILG
jgi:tyrosinase